MSLDNEYEDRATFLRDDDTVVTENDVRLLKNLIDDSWSGYVKDQSTVLDYAEATRIRLVNGNEGVLESIEESSVVDNEVTQLVYIKGRPPAPF